MENNKNLATNSVEIVLSNFDDVVNLNAFVASRPEYAVLTYKTSRLAKLWELEIEDEKNQWIVGFNISGFGDIALEHSIEVKRRRHGYVDAELAERHFQELYVVRWKGNYIFVTLPNENAKEVTIVAPLVCRHRGIEMTDVYIWRNIIGWYHILDCGSGTQVFETLSDMETWLYEIAEGKKLPWSEWYVVGGMVSDEYEVDVIKRAEVGEFAPAPHEVIELVRRLTE